MGSVVRTRKLRWLGTSLLVALGFAAGCAGKSESSNGGGAGDDDAGTSGTSGTSSIGGTGGTADGGTGGAMGGTGAVSKGGCGPGGTSGKGGCGSSGTAGAATGGITSGGTSGTSGIGGTSGVGGAVIGGAAGEPGTGAECERAEDCRMVSDCCGCRAEPNGAPGSCLLPCEQDSCALLDIDTSEVDCIMHRCVIARSCDRGRITCRSAPPECPQGTVPSIIDTCWGPCLPPTECSWVTGCADCGDAVCVEFETQLQSFTCVPPVPGCNAGSYCDCLGVCDYCSESNGNVSCACPTC